MRIHRSWSLWLRARPASAVLAVVFTGWTFFWALQAAQAVATGASLFQSGVGNGVAFNQVWEVVFVAAYFVIRWFGGVVALGALLAGWAVLRRLRLPRTRKTAFQSS